MTTSRSRSTLSAAALLAVGLAFSACGARVDDTAPAVAAPSCVDTS